MAYRPDDATAELNWNRVKDAEGYYIYMSESQTGPDQKVATLSDPKTVTWKKTGLDWGKRYYFKVKAYRIAYGTVFESVDSAAWELKVLKPPGITGVTARNLTDGRVELTLSLGDYHGYEIRQATSQDGAYEKIYDISPDWFAGYGPAYVINRADIGRPCWYKVIGYRFVNGVDGVRLYSDDSNIVPATACPARGTLEKTENIAGPPQALSCTSRTCFAPATTYIGRRATRTTFPGSKR
jgi:hypothetical protein